MGNEKIEISDGSVRIVDLDVPSRDISHYLRSMPEGERAPAIVQAIEVGVFCLERARAGHDLDFVRRQVEGLLADVEAAVMRIPNETQNQLTGRIGTGEGQVLAPVQSLVNSLSTAATKKVQEIRNLLNDQIDPSNKDSSLGRALAELRDLLNPDSTRSVQFCLEGAVKQVIGEGEPLAKSVKAVVKETLEPLEARVNELAKEVRGHEAAAEALAQTIEKGASYEEEVVRVVENWAHGLGAEVYHVGSDNRSGDVLVVLHDAHVNGVSLRIVTEARDRQDPVGRVVISQALDEAMAERGANAALYVSKSRAGLRKEIGEWAEGTSGRGSWVACTHEHLITAIRFLIAQERLQQIRTSTPSVDASSIEAQVVRIRTALKRMTTITTKVTAVQSSANEIQREAEGIRDDIKGALNDIEDALRTTGKTTVPQIPTD